MTFKFRRPTSYLYKLPYFCSQLKQNKNEQRKASKNKFKMLCMFISHRYLVDANSIMRYYNYVSLRGFYSFFLVLSSIKSIDNIEKPQKGSRYMLNFVMYRNLNLPHPTGKY